MNLMELYKTMSDINSIPKIDRNIMEQLLHSDGIAMSSTDKEGVTHILIKSFVILFWRTTSDSKVVTSLDFSPSLVMQDEEQLRAGMTPMHRHDYIEIAYVAKGEFSQLIAGEKRTFSQGSICIIDKNSEHADFIKDQDNFVIFICMKEDFFDELFLAELDDNNVQQFIRRALMKQKSLRQFLQFTPRDEQDVLFPLIEQVAKEKYENRKGAKYIIKGLIIRIFDNKEKVLEKILDGSKTMVIRAATGRKIPHSRVFVDEKLYFMKKGTAKISATATVKSVQNFVKLSEEEIVKVLGDNQEKLNLSKKQKGRWHKKCMCLVEFENVSEIEPLDFHHQGNMDDWLIIEKIEDVVV